LPLLGKEHLQPLSHGLLGTCSKLFTRQLLVNKKRHEHVTWDQGSQTHSSYGQTPGIFVSLQHLIKL
jgi:hypothetical protein